MLKYTFYRLGLFLVVMLILVLVGLDPIYAAVGAALLSMVLSVFVLAGPREEAARKIEARVEDNRVRKARKLEDERTDEEVEDQDFS